MRRARAVDGVGEILALVNRQLPLGDKTVFFSRPRALRRVYATRLQHGLAEHPVGQRRVDQGFTRGYVFVDHICYGLPASFLPQFKGPLRHAKAPAHGFIYIACGLGNIG